MLFYKNFVENLKNKLYKQNFDIFNAINNKDSENDIKDKIGEVITSILTDKIEDNNENNKKIIVKKEENIIKNKIYIALKDKLDTNKEETIKNIVRKMLLDTIKNMKLDDETIEKIYINFYNDSRNSVISNSEEDIKKLKSNLKNKIQRIISNIEVNFDKQIINLLENSKIESNDIQSLINKIKDKNKESSFKLKNLINLLNEELENNKIRIKDNNDNYILNEARVKEQFNKDLIESFCDKLIDNSKYKSDVIEEILKNNYTTKNIVCRKAINDLVDNITIVTMNGNEKLFKLNENIFKQIEENKKTIEDNIIKINDIFEESLKVTIFEPTKQYIVRYMDNLINNLLTLKLDDKKLPEQVGNKVEDLFREDKENLINNNKYKNYDNLVKNINYNIDNLAENIFKVISENDFNKVKLFYEKYNTNDDNIEKKIKNEIINTLMGIFKAESNNEQINGMESVIKGY